MSILASTKDQSASRRHPVSHGVTRTPTAPVAPVKWKPENGSQPGPVPRPNLTQRTRLARLGIHLDVRAHHELTVERRTHTAHRPPRTLALVIREIVIGGGEARTLALRARC